jgi:hypothetical protein
VIRACGKLRRSADNAGNAITISPSELGLIRRMFFHTLGISYGLYASAGPQATGDPQSVVEMST